jgi:hypothetical protein
MFRSNGRPTSGGLILINGIARSLASWPETPVLRQALTEPVMLSGSTWLDDSPNGPVRMMS